MSNKIALYKGAEKQRQIEGVLSKYLEENDIPLKIHRISNLQEFMREFWLEDDFWLFVVVEKDTVTYMLKIYKNFDRQTTRYACGTLELPLTQTGITNLMIKVLKSSRLCPYDTYAAKNNKLSCLILHEDIECIHKEKTKSVFYLSGGETMYVHKPQYEILEKLDASYFFKCRNGYIVNFFNIDRVSDDYKTLTMKSGIEIPMSRSGRNQFFKSLSLSITGFDTFYY